MQEKYMNSAVIKLIDRLGYLPIRDGNGQIPNFPGRMILANSTSRGLILVELVNADFLGLEEIQEMLYSNQLRLKNIDKAGSYNFFEVFVFSELLEPDKLQAIISGQYKEVPNKKYLSCLTVDLSKKEIMRHFEIPKIPSNIFKILDPSQTSDYETLNQIVDINELSQKKEKQYALKYSANKATLTTSLIAINVVVWLIMMAYSAMKGVDYNTVLDIFGAKENLSIMNGQYWRFLTPVFLHASIIHLMINCYSLYYVGMITEKLYGHMKFFIIYFAAGILGNILSFMFSPNPGVGASGAIFGLLGALLYFGVENPVAFKRYFGYNVILTVVINIAFGFSQSGIDNYAHMGGLLGGFLTSGIVKLNDVTNRWLKRPVFIIITMLVLVLSLTYGFTNSQNTTIIKLEKLEELNEKESWAEAEKVGMEILATNPEDKHIRLGVLWALVVTEASQGKYNKAFEYADEMIQVEPSRGYYIRGLLNLDTGKPNEAKKDLEEAKRIDPGLTETVDEFLKDLK